MPRAARKVSASGVYHIVLRGINKQTIFFDDEDKEVFVNRLKLTKQDTPYDMYAFCIMSNHIHLLIKETETAPGKVMQKILCSYVHWYNRKYERIGNLFQDRYKSEPIEKDSHLLCCLRYIHQNPVKAGMVREIGEYGWSSHGLYLNGKESFVETGFLLGMLGGVDGYEKFIKAEETNAFEEFDNAPPLSDGKLNQMIQRIYLKYNVTDIKQLGNGARDEILTIIRRIPGASIRQVSRLTGISTAIVRNAQIRK